MCHNNIKDQRSRHKKSRKEIFFYLWGFTHTTMNRGKNVDASKINWNWTRLVRGEDWMGLMNVERELANRKWKLQPRKQLARVHFQLIFWRAKLRRLRAINEKKMNFERIQRYHRKETRLWSFEPTSLSIRNGNKTVLDCLKSAEGSSTRNYWRYLWGFWLWGVFVG